MDFTQSLVVQFFGSLIGAIATLTPFVVAVFLYDPYRAQREAFDKYRSWLRVFEAELETKETILHEISQAVERIGKGYPTLVMHEGLDASFLREVRTGLMAHPRSAKLVSFIGKLIISFDGGRAHIVAHSSLFQFAANVGTGRDTEREDAHRILVMAMRVIRTGMDIVTKEVQDEIALLPSIKPRLWDAWRHHF